MVRVQTASERERISRDLAVRKNPAVVRALLAVMFREALILEHGGRKFCPCGHQCNTLPGAVSDGLAICIAAMVCLTVFVLPTRDFAYRSRKRSSNAVIGSEGRP